MRSNVDLPEPLRPTKQIRSPATTAKLAPESSGVAPKVRLTSCSRSSGGAIDGYRLKLFSTVRQRGRSLQPGCPGSPPASAAIFIARLAAHAAAKARRTRGREPMTWVPSAAGTIPQAAAAEALLDPPGVRSPSRGLRVPRGLGRRELRCHHFAEKHCASLSQHSDAGRTAAGAPTAEQRRALLGRYVGVSMMFSMPSGMPSIGDHGRPSRRRAVEWSAAARTAVMSWQTKAPTAGSNASKRVRQRSRNCGACRCQLGWRRMAWAAARSWRHSGILGYAQCPFCFQSD